MSDIRDSAANVVSNGRNHAPAIVRFGPFAVDLRSGELRRNGSRVSLQDQPLQILIVLLEHAGEMVTREELRQRLWSADTFVDFEHGLNAAVKRLRDALGDSADTPRFIETVPRRGYRFLVPVDGAAAPGSSARPAITRRRGWVAGGIAIALVAGGVAVATRIWPVRQQARPASPVRFTIDVEQSGVTAGATANANGGAVGTVAFSPDGSCVAYRGAWLGVGRVYMHSMDRLSSTALTGTEGGYGPFFSPDGRWLGFFADGRLKKISLDTLAVEALCEAPDARGGTWAADGTIFFAPRRTSPIWRVSADGGPPEAVSHLDQASGEMSHRWPRLLPGQRALLYQSMDTSEQSRIVYQSLSTGERKTVVERGEDPRLTPSGHLLFTIGNSLWAVPFDAGSVRIAGSPVEVLEKPFGGSGSAVAAGTLDVSTSGALAHMTLRQASDSMLWRVDRSGHASPISDVRRGFKWPRMSPDGQRLAVTIADDTGASIWIYDLHRRSLTRLTFDRSHNEAAIWAPDDRRLLYRSNRAGPFNLFLQAADGSGQAERLVTSETDLFAGSWSPDGRALILQEDTYAHGPDIWVQSLTGRQNRRPIANSAFGEWDGIFSPDGSLVAFTSLESGRLEVYVQPYSGPGGKRQVSNAGGNSPVWSRSGRELFYLNGDKMMVVSVSHRHGITLGKPELLFESDYAFAGHLANYDVTPDDRAFVMIRGEGREPWMQLNVVLNWSEELKRRVPRQH